MEYLPILILLLFIALGIPVAISIGIAALSFFLTSGAMPEEIFIQRMVAITHSFPLLAIPLFIATGVIMNFGGITKRIMNLAEALTGHMIGGMAQVNVLLSTLMGGMSGSANADAAMQSKILVPEMQKRNYDLSFSTAITAFSSIISVIIPPGIGLILYGFMGNVSIGKLFLAGIVPGVFLCLAMMLCVRYISKKRNFAPVYQKRASIKKILTSFKEAIWALIIPLAIIGGIRLGIFTPTEAGGMAVFIALIVSLIYREIKWMDIGKIIEETINATAIILFIIVCANSFGFYMTWEQIPLKISEMMLSLTDNYIILLLLINFLLLIVGMVMEGSAVLILLTPILVPLITHIGIDPIHFGIVMVLNITISGVTPPLGTLMFTTCSITGTPIKDFIKASVPFYLLVVTVLLILTFIPEISLWLPNLKIK